MQNQEPLIGADFSLNSEMLPVQQRIDDFFHANGKFDGEKILSQQENIIPDHFASEQKPKAPNSKTKQALSQNFKGSQKSQTQKVMTILEHRKKKGRNSNGQMEYKVQREIGNPVWETEAQLKEESREMFDVYNQGIKEAKETTPQKQNMKITQQKLKANSPFKDKKEEEKVAPKQADAGQNGQIFPDLASVFLCQLGNWKKIKRQDQKDIYKCNECEARLEVEKKGSQYRYKLVNFGDPHNWCDSKHVDAFKKQINDVSKQGGDKIHTSVESFVKLQVKKGSAISPDAILENLKKERPQLFKHFKPSQDQLTFIIMSNQKDLFKTFPDKRQTRSSKVNTPTTKVPTFLNQLNSPPPHLIASDSIVTRKREAKENEKKKHLNQSLSERLDDLLNPDELQEAEKMEIQPVAQEEVTPPNEEKEKEKEKDKEKEKLPESKTPEKLSPNKGSPKKKKHLDKQDLPQVEGDMKELGDVSNLSSKRVKFNQVVVQAEFEKLSSEDEGDSNQEDSMKFGGDSQESLESMDDINPNDIGSDDEDMMSGMFLQSIKVEQSKAMKERRFLMNELKYKERRGSIFIDQVNKVLTVVKKEHGKFDYLIEWKYNKEDKLVPTSSLVKGSHFVFSNPLMYRRYVEENFVTSQPTQINAPQK